MKDALCEVSERCYIYGCNANTYGDKRMGLLNKASLQFILCTFQLSNWKQKQFFSFTYVDWFLNQLLKAHSYSPLLAAYLK